MTSQQKILLKPLSVLLLIIWLPIYSFCQNSISGNASAGSTVIPFARVTLFNAGLTFFRETRTGIDGNFMLTNIPDGNYTLGATALGKEYMELPQSLNGDVNDLDFTLGNETHPGNWETIMTSPESLGGTDFGILLPDGKIIYCHNSKDPFLFDPVENYTAFIQGDTEVQGCVAPASLEVIAAAR